MNNVVNTIEFGNKHAIPKLSILILTIPNRAAKLKRLVSFLIKQCKGLENEVEIVTTFDRKQIRIGEKRNIALRASRGNYVTFIDDDDFISDDYVYEILSVLQYGPDCVGFKVKCEMKDIMGKVTEKSNAIISNRYDDWYHDGFEKIGDDLFKYRQFIYHKSPVRREIALQVGFKDMVMGEDYEYALRLKPLLKHERFINKYLYYYDFQKEPGGPNKRYAK